MRSRHSSAVFPSPHPYLAPSLLPSPLPTAHSGHSSTPFLCLPACLPAPAIHSQACLACGCRGSGVASSAASLPVPTPPAKAVCQTASPVSQSFPRWLRLLLRGRPRPPHRRQLPPSRGRGSRRSPTPRTARPSPRTPRGGQRRARLQVRHPTGIISKVRSCCGGRNSRWRAPYLAPGFLVVHSRIEFFLDCDSGSWVDAFI